MKAKKIELINSLPSDWYFEIADLGYRFEVEDEDKNLYYISVGGVPFGIHKNHTKVIEWDEPTKAVFTKDKEETINNVLENALIKLFSEKAKEVIKKIRTNMHDFNYKDYKDVKDENEFLIEAFVWFDSPEGFNYWDNIYIKLMNQKEKSKKILK